MFKAFVKGTADLVKINGTESISVTPTGSLLTVPVVVGGLFYQNIVSSFTGNLVLNVNEPVLGILTSVFSYILLNES